MAQFAQVDGMRVLRVVDMDPALHASWVATDNPKARCFLPVIEGPKPPHDPDTEVLYDTITVSLSGTADRTWRVRAKTPDELRRVWSSLEFLDRFTDAELEAIEQGRTSDSVVAAIYRQAMAAQEVVSDDPRTVGALQYLVSIGVLTQSRAAAILAA
jgi:hypothetical protein